MYSISIAEDSLEQPCTKCWMLQEKITLMYVGAVVLCSVSAGPVVSLAPFLISLLNFYFVKQLFQIIATILNFLLLVNDLSLGAQRKLRLQAGTPLTSCSYTYFCAFSFLLFSCYKVVSLFPSLLLLYKYFLGIAQVLF